jgi:hypothetical protein
LHFFPQAVENYGKAEMLVFGILQEATKEVFPAHSDIHEPLNPAT